MGALVEKSMLGAAARGGAHLGVLWGRAAGHRSVCQLASPVGRSPGQCPFLGSTSRLASSPRCRRFLCTGEQREGVRRDHTVVGVCAKPGQRNYVLAGDVRAGDELFPWLNGMSQPCSGCALIPWHCDPPSSHCPLHRATDKLTHSICCSVASGLLQPPSGHATPPPAP